jgi:hypothetical protein
MLNFGVGALFGTRNDISGQTPVRFGVLQSVQWNFSFTEKELMGTGQFPVDVARAQGKWTGEAEIGIINGKLLNSLFFGQTMTPGQIVAAVDEAHTVPASSPYTITPTNSSTWTQDQGVTYAGPLGLNLTSTSTAPSASATYEPSASAYTFSSSDAGANVLLNYLYTATTGETISIANQQLGTTPTFSGVFRNRDPNTGLYMTLVINRMTCSDLSFSSKTSDFTMPKMKLTIMDDGTGNIGKLSFGDLS